MRCEAHTALFFLLHTAPGPAGVKGPTRRGRGNKWNISSVLKVFCWLNRRGTEGSGLTGACKDTMAELLFYSDIVFQERNETFSCSCISVSLLWVSGWRVRCNGCSFKGREVLLWHSLCVCVCVCVCVFVCNRWLLACRGTVANSLKRHS